MEITAFEKAFETLTRRMPESPLLATAGTGLRLDAGMPVEFQTAARTLLNRSGEPGRESGILRAAAQWT